ncbi:hypothetical protein BMJ27_07440 [Sinorhizobium medicae]|uniref:hypothetical protein n=1 Tax=Sinorhizobium medicae TaxID=110321 RepID=UPI000C7A8D16|nr:hypothetical protein [Sinorhizobium medicae]PLU37987.1 hypothetical protein BMJ27_07440 [Sinorhizobium medicae]
MTRRRNKAQWIVDKTGMTGDGDYWIEKHRLLDMRDGLYEWPLQVCTKTWVDFPAFCLAFEQALQFHNKRYSRSRLAATVAECQRRIQHASDYAALAREMYPKKYRERFQVWRTREMVAVNDELNRRCAAARAANDDGAAQSAA